MTYSQKSGRLVEGGQQHSPDEVAPSGHREADKRSSSRRRLIKGTVAVAGAVVATHYVKPTMRAMGVPSARAVSPVPPPEQPPTEQPPTEQPTTELPPPPSLPPPSVVSMVQEPQDPTPTATPVPTVIAGGEVLPTALPKAGGVPLPVNGSVLAFGGLAIGGLGLALRRRKSGEREDRTGDSCTTEPSED